MIPKAWLLQVERQAGLRPPVVVWVSVGEAQAAAGSRLFEAPDRVMNELNRLLGTATLLLHSGAECRGEVRVSNLNKLISISGQVIGAPREAPTAKLQIHLECHCGWSGSSCGERVPSQCNDCSARLHVKVLSKISEVTSPRSLLLATEHMNIEVFSYQVQLLDLLGTRVEVVGVLDSQTDGEAAETFFLRSFGIRGAVRTWKRSNQDLWGRESNSTSIPVEPIILETYRRDGHRFLWLLVQHSFPENFDLTLRVSLFLFLFGGSKQTSIPPLVILITCATQGLLKEIEAFLTKTSADIFSSSALDKGLRHPAAWVQTKPRLVRTGPLAGGRRCIVRDLHLASVRKQILFLELVQARNFGVEGLNVSLTGSLLLLSSDVEGSSSLAADTGSMIDVSIRAEPGKYSLPRVATYDFLEALRDVSITTSPSQGLMQSAVRYAETHLDAIPLSIAAGERSRHLSSQNGLKISALLSTARAVAAASLHGTITSLHVNYAAEMLQLLGTGCGTTVAPSRTGKNTKGKGLPALLTALTGKLEIFIGKEISHQVVMNLASNVVNARKANLSARDLLASANEGGIVIKTSKGEWRVL